MSMGVWQGMVMDSLKLHPGPPCPTLLRPAGGSPMKQPYGHFMGGLPAGWPACGCPLPHVVRLSFCPTTNLYFCSVLLWRLQPAPSLDRYDHSEPRPSGRPPHRRKKRGIPRDGSINRSRVLRSTTTVLYKLVMSDKKHYLSDNLT
jgi:hypothetical protein